MLEERFLIGIDFVGETLFVGLASRSWILSSVAIVFLVAASLDSVEKIHVAYVLFLTVFVAAFVVVLRLVVVAFEIALGIAVIAFVIVLGIAVIAFAVFLLRAVIVFVDRIVPVSVHVLVFVETFALLLVFLVLV